MQNYQDNLIGRVGGALAPIKDVLVTVTNTETKLPATLFSDNGVTPLQQPLVTDDNGRFSFYAADGKYMLTFSGKKVDTFTREIVLDDPIDNPVATLAQLRAPSGATLVNYGDRPVADKLGEWVSVKDKGAVGDGVADDTNAILAAIAAADVVVFPAGVYMSSNITVNKNITLLSEGATIKRISTDTANSLVRFLGAKARTRGIKFDGNRVNNPNACNVVTVEPACYDFDSELCEYRGGKTVAGYGQGLTIIGAGNSQERYRVVNNRFTDNDADGLTVNDADNLTIEGNDSFYNRGSGLVLNNYDQTFAKKVSWFNVSNNRAYGNTKSGIVIGNYIENNDLAAPVFGFSNMEVQLGIVHGNVARNNNGYGYVLQAQYVKFTSNECRSNGVDSGGNGGMVANCSRCIVSANSFTDNYNWVLDAGGARETLFSSNFFGYNGQVAGSSSPLNVGGGKNNHVVGNYFIGNPHLNISILRNEGTGGGAFFPDAANQTVINGNYISMVAGAVGVLVKDGVDDVAVTNNVFYLADSNLDNCIRAITRRATIRGNSVGNEKSVILAPDASGYLYIPDVLDTCEVNTAATINGVRTSTMKHVASGIAWGTVTAGGSGYTSEPTVTITGDGTGATARAIIYKGAVIGIKIETLGTGYTTASIAIDGGGGTGATATPQVGMPLQNRLERSIYFNQTCTITKAGSPVVGYPAAGNLTVNATGFVTLYSFSGQWRVKSQVIA